MPSRALLPQSLFFMTHSLLISINSSPDRLPPKRPRFEFEVVSATLKGLMPKAWMEDPMAEVSAARREIYVSGRDPYGLSFRGVPLEGFVSAPGPAPCCKSCADYEIDMYKITETTRLKDTHAMNTTPNWVADMEMDRVASMLMHMLATLHSGGSDVVDTPTVPIPPPTDLHEALHDLVARCQLLFFELHEDRSRGHGFHVAIVAKLRSGGGRPAGVSDRVLVRAVQAEFPDTKDFRRWMGREESPWMKTFQFSLTLAPGVLDDADGKPIEIGLPPSGVCGWGRGARCIVMNWTSGRALPQIVSSIGALADEYLRTVARRRVLAALESVTTRIGSAAMHQVVRAGALGAAYRVKH